MHKFFVVAMHALLANKRNSAMHCCRGALLSTTTLLPASPVHQLAVERVKRVVAETRAYNPANGINALALEDALVLVMKERGISQFLETMIQTRELFGRRGPQGLILVGPRNSGKRRVIDQGLVDADQDTLLRAEFSEFIHEARERLVMFRRDRSLRLRDPVPHLVSQMVKPKLIGGDGLKLLVLENMDVYNLSHAWILRRLFLGLFGRGVGVVITTQRPPMHWYHKGVHAHKLAPFVDLMRSRCEILRLDPVVVSDGELHK